MSLLGIERHPTRSNDCTKLSIGAALKIPLSPCGRGLQHADYPSGLSRVRGPFPATVFLAESSFEMLGKGWKNTGPDGALEDLI